MPPKMLRNKSNLGLCMVIAAPVLAAPWRLAFDRAARAVQSLHLWDDDHGQPGLEEAQAKIVVLVIQEKRFIKKPCGPANTHAQQHGRAAHKAHARGARGAGAFGGPQGAGPAVVHVGPALGAGQLRGQHGGLGVGVGFNLGGKRSGEVLDSRLAVTIVGPDGKHAWEGRADASPRATSKDAESRPLATEMADKLFSGFPGESGATIGAR